MKDAEWTILLRHYRFGLAHLSLLGRGVDNSSVQRTLAKEMGTTATHSNYFL